MKAQNSRTGIPLVLLMVLSLMSNLLTTEALACVAPNSVPLNGVCFDYGFQSVPPAGTEESACNSACQDGRRCYSNGTVFARCLDSAPPPSSFAILWQTPSHDFGDVPVGLSPTFDIRFLNRPTSISTSGCSISVGNSTAFSIAPLPAACNLLSAPELCSGITLTANVTAVGVQTTSVVLTCDDGTSQTGVFRFNGVNSGCGLDPGDCNRQGATCLCNPGFIKVSKPSQIALRIPCGTTEVAILKEQIRSLNASREWRLAQIFLDRLQALCPFEAESAQAQTIPCLSGHCSQQLLDFCNNQNSAACTRTYQFTSLGNDPTGCTPLGAACSITIDCSAWQSSGGLSNRTCTVDDQCFGKPYNTCMPYNQSSLFSGAQIKQQVAGVPTTATGSQICIPDCERFGGVADSGLRFSWSGPNAGKCVCANGYVYNRIARVCQPPEQLTGCSEGGGNVPPSEVAATVRGGSDTGFVGSFRNAVNKKLNCCLNGNPRDFVGRKFDCVDNNLSAPTDFDSLWASVDADVDGGQLNALVLAGAGGVPLTGFYSVDGKRAPQFSEFSSDTITRVVIDPKTNSIQSTLGTIPKPVGAAFDDLVSRLGSRSVPTSIQDRIRYPILVRAAAIYDCPRNPITVGPLRTLQTLTAGSVTKEICPVASTVKIHFRIEQVSEILGTPPMKTIDSVLDQTQKDALSVEKILERKYGPPCAPGLIRQGDACVY